MAPNRRMAALSVGVGDASHLAFLQGAVNGAKAFHEWAKALGYESRLLTDEDSPVTIERLRQELLAIVASGTTPIHRLLLYFAGHGLIREAEEGLWLLSDWHEQLRAIAVEALKRRLYLYGVQQLAIFADACRSLPKDIVAADLTADAVLGRGPAKPTTSPAIDKFIAAQDGAETFMIPGADPEDDRCLFSGVLLEGLWGTRPAAFSKVLVGKVTSRSLGAYLTSEVPQVAARYGFTVVPTVLPTFPDEDDIYFGDDTPPPAPAFPAWPPPGPLTGMGLRSAKRRRRSPGVPIGPPPSAERTPDAMLNALTEQEVPHAFETEAGFAVEGQQVVAVWTPDDAFAEVHGDARWWRVGGSKRSYQLERPTPVLIEFASGLFAATTALPRFIASLLCDERGVSALIYREIHTRRTIAVDTERIISELERGALRADAATDFALDLRQDKHADPVRGVISAYLYDSIGDVDNIRRMAFYYVQHSQPIPYDIALLAQLEGERRDGLLWATVPRVKARAPRTERETGFQWAYGETPEAAGFVGGLWPLMRQGWSFLADPADDGSTLRV